MSKKILVIEDEPGIKLSLTDEFESENFIVYTANDGQEGIELAKKYKPDVIILDIMLPILDGYEVCKKLRKDEDMTPIIMLTVKDKELDKVLGLELGADDYVTKPFSVRELLARVKAILRRVEDRFAEIGNYCIGDVELDFNNYEAVKQGKIIDFTNLEFQILKLLIKNCGKFLTRDDFLDKVWSDNNLIVSSRTIDSHIVNIRKKIEDDPSNPKYIISKRGIGYKLVNVNTLSAQ